MQLHNGEICSEALRLIRSCLGDQLECARFLPMRREPSHKTYTMSSLKKSRTSAND